MLLRRKRKRKSPRKYRQVIGCTYLKGRITSCGMLCTPIDGMGQCGRIAPHALRSRTQQAIDGYKRSLLTARPGTAGDPLSGETGAQPGALFSQPLVPADDSPGSGPS